VLPAAFDWRVGAGAGACRVFGSLGRFVRLDDKFGSTPDDLGPSEADPNYPTTGLDRKQRFDWSNYYRFEPVLSGSQYVTEA
jgi:hypothetical protein